MATADEEHLKLSRCEVQNADSDEMTLQKGGTIMIDS